MATRHPVEEHPDLLEMRAKYERAAQAPTVQVVSGLTFMAGLYLAISPWVIGFADSANLTVSDLVVGIALALLGLGYASVYGRTHGIAWVAPLIGVWAIISPWVVTAAPTNASTLLSNIITGGVAVILGIATVAAGVMPMSRR